MKRQKVLLLSIAIIMLLSLAVPNFALITTNTIPDERLLPRLVDQADLLTDDEQSHILGRLNEISEKNEFDVVIVLLDDRGGLSPMEFTDDYYDYNGFGYGENHDGLCLSIDVSDRQWWVSTMGFGITAIADDSREYIMDRVVIPLKYDHYYDALNEFLDYMDDFVSAARAGKPYTGRQLSKYGKTWASPLWWAIPIGFLIAACIMIYHIISTNDVKPKQLADEYIVPNSLNIAVSKDQFLYRNISRTVRAKDDSSSGGSSGGGTHTSSSGSSHGGGGGSF